ncbi:MAG: protein-L-isoaspartate(D-aspartate) O-methyltransferase [Gemmatimonadota bacterium]|nr:protein-L-isoaspartate(D-aspartate) O-methyltransferase [Gemmatimonadota bacterium]
MVARGVIGGDSYGGYRSQLVATLQSKGIRDLAVLRAISLVPRHLFVPESLRHRAYEDSALPIGGGQTISQPWVQARSLELAALTGKERVLEIGTGSGYQTALLSQLAAQVFSVERLPTLGQGARRALELAGARNVSVMIGDGTLGWRPYAPYDAIIVAAASPEVPAPLAEQLAVGGHLIIPLGERDQQVLTIFTRTAEGAPLQRQSVTEVRFVPLLGQFGFTSDPAP